MGRLNWEELRKTMLQGIALIGMHVLAFVYDAEFVPLALGVDAVILGVTIYAKATSQKDAPIS